MKTELFVGVDIGTTVTKAAVVAADGRELGWGMAPTSWRNVPTGAETTPADILLGVLEALAAALEAVPQGAVVAVGVTSMAETAVLLGDDGLPVGNSIAWHDTRGEGEAGELEAVFGPEVFSARTGLPPSHVCTLAKLAWMSRHGAIGGRRAMTVADWVVHALGGEQATEASLASRTGALSLSGRQWWGEALEWAGAPTDLFPPVDQAGRPRGRARLTALPDLLRPLSAASRSIGPALDRLSGALLASAGHDHLCVAAGTGATAEDQVLDSCGTAEAFARRVKPMGSPAVSEIVRSGLAVGWHNVPDSYVLLTGHLLGLVLDRVLRLLGLSGREAQVALDRDSANVLPGTLRVVSDERSSTSTVMGVGGDASPAALWAAVRQATASGAQEVLAAMEHVGGPVREIVLSGGWSHLEGLREDRRRLSSTMRWPAVTEAGARGAALFGSCAAGLYPGPEAFPVPPEHV
jgi:sugar (pentulose or hexulose) kinase